MLLTSFLLCFLLSAFYYSGDDITILLWHANALGHSDWRWQEVVYPQTVCVCMCTFGMGLAMSNQADSSTQCWSCHSMCFHTV